MFRIAKTLAKPVMYTAIAALCLNLNTIKDHAVEWWSAPTTLELGDWTRVRSCDTCNAASDATTTLCRQCGGETFTERKGQSLWEPTWAWSDRDDQIESIRGYVFQDGTATVVPGHWVIPEREVKS